MSYSREDWCEAFLVAIGNTTPTQSVLNWVIMWTAFESSPPGALYNLLNTTQRMNGSSNYNAVGVQNFVDFTQGITANKIVLFNGYYPHLADALVHDDEYKLGFNGSKLVESNILRELNIWCGGCNYGSHFIDNPGTHATDMFSGTMPSTPEPSPPVTTDYKLRQFNDMWQASGQRQGTGIEAACRIAYSQHNLYVAFPTHAEVRSFSWSGDDVAIQSLSSGIRAEYNFRTHHTSFIVATNTIILIV
jgi:hypothetical protein